MGTYSGIGIFLMHYDNHNSTLYVTSSILKSFVYIREYKTAIQNMNFLFAVSVLNIILPFLLPRYIYDLNFAIKQFCFLFKKS